MPEWIWTYGLEGVLGGRWAPAIPHTCRRAAFWVVVLSLLVGRHTRRRRAGAPHAS